MSRGRVITKVSGDGIRGLGKRINEIATGLDLTAPAFRKAAQALLKDLDTINEHDRLKGLDRRGKPLEPVTYRPIHNAAPTPVGVRRQKFAKKANYGNLTSSEYRKLDGPPLAPRRKASRVISNYVVGFEFFRKEWRVRAGWKNLLDSKGKPFLAYHLAGTGNLPKRDIGGLSAKAVERLQALALKEFRRVK